MNEQERLNALTAPLLTWYDIHKRVLPSVSYTHLTLPTKLEV